MEVQSPRFYRTGRADARATREANPGLIQERLATRFPNADTLTILNNWTSSLEIMVARAADSESCKLGCSD
jgi:hypothetical protein